MVNVDAPPHESLSTVPPIEPDPPPPSTQIASQPTKRQRRPSVRLGEIDSLIRPSKTHNHPSWRPPKDTTKARSLTNLVNGSTDNDHLLQEVNDNGATEVNLEFTHRKKAKRATSKRWRSNNFNWVSSRPNEEGEGDGGLRDFAPDSESPNHSDEAGVDTSHDSKGDTRRIRVDEGGSGGSEMVRTWLIELGLSRYAPVFEIHEVDDEVLPLLTLEDLKEMGINAVGSRRKMFSAIQKLGKGLT